MIRSPIFGLSDRAVKLVNNNDVHFGGRSEGEGPCAACDEIETYCLEISFFLIIIIIVLFILYILLFQRLNLFA